MAHNHPTGVLKPSEADIRMTKNIQNAGEILDIKLLTISSLAKIHFTVCRSRFIMIKRLKYEEVDWQKYQNCLEKSEQYIFFADKKNI